MSRGPWIYNGSRLVDGLFLAQSTQSFIAIMEDLDALINNPRPGRDNDKIWIAEENVIPPPGTPITIVIELPRPTPTSPVPAPAPARPQPGPPPPA